MKYGIPEIVALNSDDECIIALNLKTSIYATFEKTGKFIIELLQNNFISLDEIAEALTKHYAVGFDTATAESLNFLNTCIDAGFVEVKE